MAAGIFVSYRRDDARHAAGRLADDLAGHFGPGRIFRDIEGIEPGVDFRVALEQALAACAAMVVLIGPHWAGAADAQGRPRLQQPNDWIRMEIATALARGIRVVPVLLEGTPLPDEDRLPDDLKPLLRRQALELSDTRWRGDLQRLVETLGKIPGLAPPPAPPLPPPPPPGPGPAAGKRWKKLASYAVGAVIVLAVVLELASQQGADDDAAQPLPAPQPAPSPQPQPLAGLPDISGAWNTLNGETYQIAQAGSGIQLAAFAMGQPTGGGEGHFDGRQLDLQLRLALQGTQVALQCRMQPTPDLRRFVGMCNGPTGTFPAQFFR